MIIKLQQLSIRGIQLTLMLLFSISVAGYSCFFAPSWAALIPSPVVVSAQVKVEFSAITYNRRTNTFDTLAELQNRSKKPISTPIRLVINNIRPNTVSLANANGLLQNGQPYVDVPVKDGILSPREEVENIRLKFNNPKRVKFTFKHQVLGTIPHANHPPVANAGPDQSAFVGTSVTLDGSGSTDEDGDPLTYHWRIAAQPAENAAAIDDINAVTPTVTIHQKGIYKIELIVNDGKANSTPSIVTITTENSKPVAVAGNDQTVFVKQTVLLDGVLSTDIDGDPLTYRWELSAKPTGSLAALQGADTQMPSFAPDKPGIYTITLIVNDGLVDSAADQVLVSTQNSKSVANAGPDQTGKTAGIPVELDGSLSFDVDGDTLTYTWSILHQPTGSTAQIKPEDKVKVKTVFTPNIVGEYVIQLIVNDGQANSDPITALVTVTVGPVNNPPHITSSPTITATVGSLYSYDVDATDADNDTLVYSLTAKPTGMSIDAQTGLITWTPATDQTGAQAVTVSVTDGKASDSQNYTITVDPSGLISVPDLTNLSRSAAEAALHATKLTVGTLTFVHNSATSGSVMSQIPNAGASVAVGTTIAMTISLGPDLGLPPDPVVVAPNIDTTVATTVYDSTQFLYTGSNLIQTGVVPGTIEPKRAAVVRGKVLDKQNNALSGVAITVLDHPEFGQTLSRADGAFDLAVNGGGLVTVNYKKAGFMPAQRQVQAPWQDYAFTPDVVLVQLDTKVTSIDLTSTAPIQVAQGSLVTDKDGSRTATLMIPQGTQVQVYLPNGATQSVNNLHLHLTEYTADENGPQAMPGQLPPPSAYTYAVELKAEEATTKIAGKDVLFSQPVPFYVDNFLDFIIGAPVPLGYYDYQKAAWIPVESGRVIKILGIVNNLAQIDTDGDGVADNGLGISDPERQQLASLYPEGKSLWRMTLAHLSTYDANQGLRCVRTADCTQFNPERPLKPKPSEIPDPDCQEGSVIECQNQVLGESLGVIGTSFNLNYRSNRVQGFKSSGLDIPLSNKILPKGLKGITLEVLVAGRYFVQDFGALPNLSTTFYWDGKDGYGNTLQGRQPATVRIGYIYGMEYGPAPSFGFYSSGGTVSASGDTARQNMTIWLTLKTHLGIMNAQNDGLGGWALDIHHIYDPVEKILYLGSGQKRSAKSLSSIITTVAGTGNRLISGDGRPADQASLDFPLDVAVGADGSFYIAEMELPGYAKVRRVKPDGIISTAAGTGSSIYGGDGEPATLAGLGARSIALGPDGSLYISGLVYIRRVWPNGIITTVAGNGLIGYSGDGGQATQASFSDMKGIAVGADSSLYITDVGYIRRVGPDGIIRRVAGNGSAIFSGDGGPATEAGLGNSTQDVAMGLDGNLYIVDGNNRIRRVTPDGIITTVAGNGVSGYSGDGGPAIQAQLNGPSSVSVGVDGSLYIGENGRIRQVTPDGIIRTVAGNGTGTFSGDGGPATQAGLSSLGIALGPDGSVYDADTFNWRIRRVAPAMPGFDATDLSIPSEDGAEVYRFDINGRHLSTVNALTGAVLDQFAYDAANRLIRVTDGDGNITTIERDTLGNPTAIVAPFGQRTTLNLDANDYLANVSNPAGEAHHMEYKTDGLLTRFSDPKDNASTMTYDAEGLLIRDADAGGGYKTLTRQEANRSWTVNISTALSRNNSYQVDDLTTGDQQRINTGRDGTQTTTLIGTNGSWKTTFPDGTITNLLKGPDPRFAMQTPIAKSLAVTTGGLTSALSTVRTATLVDSNNPLSLSTLTDTVTLNGRISTSVYDAATKTATNTSAVGRTSKAIIDNLGRIVQSQVTGILPSNLTYDTRGRLASVSKGTVPDARTAMFSYNPEGYLDTVIDPLGRALSYDYDAVGRVTRQTLTDGREIAYAYDANGNLTSLTPPGRPGHLFHYTDRNQTAAYEPPPVVGTGNTLYDYDLDKALTKITRPDGQTLNFGYDTAGRLSVLTLPTGEISYAYSPATGKITGITAPDNGTLSYTYNGALLTQTAWNGTVAGSIDRTYDNDFRVTSLSINGANAIAFQYDADSLLTKAGNLTLTRNAQNGLLTGTALGSLTDSYSYDGFAEVTAYEAKYDTFSLLRFEYDHDKLDRITQKREIQSGTTHTFDYGYDTAGRLIEVKRDGAVTSSYGYDANGNRTHLNGAEIAHYDDQDRLFDYQGVTYEYTANGELLQKTVTGQATQYDYDVLGNLRKVTFPGGTVIDYVIDGQNRRIGKKRNGTLEQGFLYQGQLAPIAELDGTGAVVSRFVYATGVNVPDYMIKGGVTYRLVKDHLGSPRLVVDVTTDTVAQEMDYDVFGKVTLDTNPGFQPFGFAGGLYDRDTKLVRFGARDYEAETGRWTAKDPILFGGGDTNLYGYVLGDPLNWVDLAGLDDSPCDEVGKRVIKKTTQELIKRKTEIPNWKNPPSNKELEDLQKMDEKRAEDSVNPYSNTLTDLWKWATDALSGGSEDAGTPVQPRSKNKLPEFKPAN